MAEPELEEGEACYYKDDTSIDPDIALSYIDEKLQNVLGHFQKDFEGGVSAENLGAKFGGYGSFLPTYQRSPSVRSYPTSHQRSQNNITSKSPNNFHLEDVPQNSLVPSDVPIPFKHVSTSLGMHSLHDSTSADGSVKMDSCLLSPQVEAKVPKKHEPFSTKSVNPTDQKTLRVRIKMGSDIAAQKNAAIYCGLGLISPSSSTGHSPDESGGEPLESQENPDESPASILQCMTSFPVAGAVLLSPLHDNLLHLIRKEDLSLDSNSSIPIRHRQKDSAVSVDDSASVLGNIKVSKDKKTKSIGKIKTLEETKHRVGVDFEDNMTSLVEENMEIETLERKHCFSTDLKFKPLSTPKCDIGESLKCAGRTVEAHRESKKGVPLKKRDVNKDWLKDRLICTGLAKEESVESMYGQDVAKYEQRAPKSSLVEKIGEHRVRSSEKDISVDPMGGGRTKGNRVPILFKPEHDVSKSEKDSNSAPINRLKQKVGLRGTQNEQDRIELPQGKKKFSLDGKHKSKGRQRNSKLTLNLADESLRSGVCKLKSKKTAQKDVAKLHASYDGILDIRSGHMANQMNPLERPSGDRVKDYNLETVKEKEATKDGPCTQGLSSEMELASVAPLIIEENWVQCDSCEKWRLLPYGTKPDQLPDNWLCSMLNWLAYSERRRHYSTCTHHTQMKTASQKPEYFLLINVRPGMNRCDISQDKTEKALRALYQPAVPLTESLNSFRSHSDQITGVTSADVQSFSQNYQDLSSDAMQNRGKKKHTKEIPHAVSNCGLIQTSSLTKNLRQEDLRNRSLNDKDQVLLKRSKMNKSTTQRPDKSSSFALERYADKQKEKQVDEGATKGTKMKAKRESDQYEYESSKRIKTEAALHPDEYWNSENAGNLGKVGLRSISDLPNRTAGKDLQKATERHNSKDETCDLKDRLLISAKKQRDTTLVFPDSGSLEIKTGNEREIYAKKRKLKDWQDSQNNLETLQSNGNRHPDGKVSWMEEHVNSEYRKEKKSRLSKTEGQESSTSRGEDRSNRKGKVTRILLSGRRDNSSVKNDQQQKNIEKVASQITLDNMDLLKKDLGSELFSMASTLSSSKVSDSRKRSICQEVKGSSVESVSSSPMKMSNQYKVSSTRRGSSGKDYAKIGDSPVMGGPRKSLERKSKLEGNRTGTARKGESSGVFQSDPVGCPGLEFREHDGSGKAESSVEPPLDFKNNHLSADGTLTQQLPCPTDVHASDHCNSEERMNTKINLISGKASSLLSNDKEKSSHNVQKVAVKFSGLLSEQGLYPKNIQRDEMQIDNHRRAQHHEDIDAKKHVSNGCNIISKDDKNVGMKDSENWEGISQREIQTKIREHNESNATLGELCSVHERATLCQNSEGEIVKRNPTQVESRFGKIQVNLRHAGKQDTLARGHQPISGSLKGSGFAVRPVDGSGDLLKVLQQPGNSANQNGTHQSWGNPVADLSVSRDLTAPNPMKGDFSSQAATNVLKEAERLRGCADHLKNSGFKFESNMTYFQAALKFLLGASLLETSKYESSKHGEMSQIQIYNSTAKLCETCAHEFEKQEEMAATALAYKCMEVACMRVVYCKSSSTNRDWHDLQASLQMVPQGESPSSSASDIDNLNNQVTVDKTALSRGMASNAGNHLIVARRSPSFVRLLDFMNDVSSAMEASRRSQIAFAAANVILEKAQNNEGVISVKRVIDFSFQDVEELLRLVRLAFEATSLQCFRENMD